MMASTPVDLTPDSENSSDAAVRKISGWGLRAPAQADETSRSSRAGLPDSTARSTRGRVWVLLYSEKCASRRHAMSREWHLKRDRAFRKKLAHKLKSEHAG